VHRWPQIVSLVFLSMVTSQLAAQQQPLPDFSKVQVETQKVTGNIYMLVGAGGNIAVSAGDDGVLMVDTEYPPMFEKIEAALKKISDKPLRFVIDTHWHLDHASGNENFARAGAIIVAQENVRRILASGTMRDGVNYPPFPKDDLPAVTYNDHATIYWNGEPVKLIHYPNAHTDGDTVVYFANSHVLDTGDNYRTDGFPLVDQDNGGSVKGIITTLDNIMETYPPDTRVIPGHGPSAMTVADIKSFADMLKDCRARVEKGIAAGKTVEQLKQGKVLAGYEKYSGRVTSEHFTEMLYRELTEKR
jgi:cyclase